MCIALLRSARVLACDNMGYMLSSVILLRNLMSITVCHLHVPSALVVYTTKHGYVNGVGPLQSMRLWQWGLSNSVLTILQSFGPSVYILALPALNFLNWQSVRCLSIDFLESSLLFQCPSISSV